MIASSNGHQATSFVNNIGLVKNISLWYCAAKNSETINSNGNGRAYFHAPKPDSKVTIYVDLIFQCYQGRTKVV